MSADQLSIDALSAEAEEAHENEAFIVDVDGYEGPLHLLLELARRQKVDLRKVSILALAEQYLGFIEDLKSRRIDLAADYLLMAAWLAFMKSRLLLPKPEALPDDDEASGEDMAARLAFRLKRLDAMREAGQALMNGPLLDTVVYLRGDPQQPKVIKRTEYSATLWEITQAFGTIRDRREKEAPHVVEQQFVLPLETARESLKGFAALLREWETLDNLRRRMIGISVDIPPRSVTASVFSAALELTRDGEVDVRQDAHFAPLYLRGARKPAGEALEQ